MEGRGAETAAANQAAESSPAGIGRLLDRWQATNDPEQLAVLVGAVRPMVEAVAVRVLRSRRIKDQSAVDDVLSLVLDHLRRLPGGQEGERPVAMFRGADPGSDSGGRFIRLLARNRSLDVARSHRRHRRYECPFSSAGDTVRWSLANPDDAARQEAEADVHDRLVVAIDRLEPDLQAVVRMLLDGKSQAVIAHVLGVCPGTVSRARRRAMAKLRGLMGS
ncbi:MAG: sigma-70 family RNA polymerase sigma factor [Planctomycetaceae bacterium]|jgi:RNA polymerase sigma factor (sigma-70 family)|nr:sigma-70 family RNA polymerase sigma factor [Planctomycetaceae bacterium]